VGGGMKIDLCGDEDQTKSLMERGVLNQSIVGIEFDLNVASFHLSNGFILQITLGKEGMVAVLEPKKTGSLQ
jgi:hypothetical protein